MTRRPPPKQQPMTNLLRKAIQTCGRSPYQLAKEAGIKDNLIYRFMKGAAPRETARQETGTRSPGRLRRRARAKRREPVARRAAPREPRASSDRIVPGWPVPPFDWNVALLGSRAGGPAAAPCLRARIARGIRASPLQQSDPVDDSRKEQRARDDREGGKREVTTQRHAVRARGRVDHVGAAGNPAHQHEERGMAGG